MEDINKFITDRVLSLKIEADSLNPNEKITFRLMEDEKLTKSSAGAATQRNIIFYNPKWITEAMLAHELLHIILNRSGWPEVISLVPSNSDNFSKRLADTIDNLFDHFNFYKRFTELGLDDSIYRDWFVRKIKNWPKLPEKDSPELLWNAFNILEAIIFGDPYRNIAIAATRNKCPKALALALRFEGVFLNASDHSMETTRLAILKLIDMLENLINHQARSEIRLKERIGVSPLFSENDLSQPTTFLLIPLSRFTEFTNMKMWILSVILKSDQSHIYSYCVPDATYEIPQLSEIRRKMRSLDLKTFLDSEKIKYGVIGIK